MAEQVWRCRIDGQERGPLTDKELRLLAHSGALKPTDSVWHEAMQSWIPAKRLKGLFASELARNLEQQPPTSEKQVGQAQSEPRTSAMAIASLVLGLISIGIIVFSCLSGFTLGGYGGAGQAVGAAVWPSALIALVGFGFGLGAHYAIKRSGGQLQGAGFALAGRLLSIPPILLAVAGTAFVIYLIVAIARPQAHSVNIDATKVLIASVSDATEAYNANIGHYPTDEEGGLTALLVKPSFSDKSLAEKWRGPYVKQEPKDHWGNKLNYQVAQPGTPEADQTPFKLWSNGPDGVDGTDDDIKNWSDQTTAHHGTSQGKQY